MIPNVSFRAINLKAAMTPLGRKCRMTFRKPPISARSAEMPVPHPFLLVATVRLQAAEKQKTADLTLRPPVAFEIRRYVPYSLRLRV
jgi:hypothetical protein